MQVANDDDKEVFNGDLGRVRAVDAEAGEPVVDFDGRDVVYDFGELDELVLAYATTIHKAQGSAYPAVVLPVTTQHGPMLQRNCSTRVSPAGGGWWCWWRSLAAVYVRIYVRTQASFY
jgi:exodeoxyribonuclease V alpha subunit